MTRRTLSLVVLACLCAGLVGCGLGPGDTKGGAGAKLQVTRDFGQKHVASGSLKKVRASDTVMRFLRANAKTTTRYGGGFVQSINGIAGGGSGGRQDWFYFVNGVEAPSGAADRQLSAGDVVQWDFRTWNATPRVPAIVGAFPEPFLHGQKGKRYPTRVECGGSQAACDAVQEKLDAAGILAGSGTIGAEARGGVMRIEVGTWRELRKLQDADVLERGPRASGVYVRFASEGSKLELLDARGEVAQTAPAGSGLVAAILPEEQQPLWVVTGVDDAGVMRAAGLLVASTLRNAYAVAATPSGPVRLPVEARG